MFEFGLLLTSKSYRCFFARFPECPCNVVGLCVATCDIQIRWSNRSWVVQSWYLENHAKYGILVPRNRSWVVQSWSMENHVKNQVRSTIERSTLGTKSFSRRIERICTILTQTSMRDSICDRMATPTIQEPGDLGFLFWHDRYLNKVEKKHLNTDLGMICNTVLRTAFRLAHFYLVVYMSLLGCAVVISVDYSNSYKRRFF
jgi:hypothetical protein